MIKGRYVGNGYEIYIGRIFDILESMYPRKGQVQQVSNANVAARFKIERGKRLTSVVEAHSNVDGEKTRLPLARE